MDVEIIAAIIDGGLGVVGIVAVVGFAGWVITKLMRTHHDNQEKVVVALNDLAHNINRMRDEQGTVCKADPSMEKRIGERRETER